MRFYMLDALAGVTIKHVLPAGNAWAQEAQRLLFSELGQVSVRNLMVAIVSH
jgi:hypothetical protein